MERPDIVTKLYIPASRVFAVTQPIPFYLTLESSAVSLAAFLPFSPKAGTSSAGKVTRVQLMRQTTVDVKYRQVYVLLLNFFFNNTLGTRRMVRLRLTSGELTTLAKAPLQLSSVNSSSQNLIVNLISIDA